MALGWDTGQVDRLALSRQVVHRDPHEPRRRAAQEAGDRGGQGRLAFGAGLERRREPGVVGEPPAQGSTVVLAGGEGASPGLVVRELTGASAQGEILIGQQRRERRQVVGVGRDQAAPRQPRRRVESLAIPFEEQHA
jgi:hypothetical protein